MDLVTDSQQLGFPIGFILYHRGSRILQPIECFTGQKKAEILHHCFAVSTQPFKKRPHERARVHTHTHIVCIHNDTHNNEFFFI